MLLPRLFCSCHSPAACGTSSTAAQFADGPCSAASSAVAAASLLTSLGIQTCWQHRWWCIWYLMDLMSFLVKSWADVRVAWFFNIQQDEKRTQGLEPPQRLPKWSPKQEDRRQAHAILFGQHPVKVPTQHCEPWMLEAWGLHHDAALADKGQNNIQAHHGQNGYKRAVSYLRQVKNILKRRKFETYIYIYI